MAAPDGVLDREKATGRIEFGRSPVVVLSKPCPFVDPTSISFPSSLPGCGALLTTMLITNAVKEEWGDFIYGLLAPGATLLAKWLPVFFVPSLVTLSLAKRVWVLV